MRIKKPAVALVSAAALVTLAACGGSGSSPTAVPTNAATDQGAVGDAFDPEAQAPAPEIEGAQQGGDITLLTSGGTHPFDPTVAYYVDTVAVLSNLVTRSLTQYVYRDGDMTLVPDMATDLGRPNEDGTEWTFTLRDGIKYEDGTDVQAEDIAYSIKRSFAQEELPGGPTYQQAYFLDGDTYKGPYQDGDNYAGVVVDGQDITIKMSQPFPDMSYYASFPLFTAIPQAKDNPNDPLSYGDHPIATGPYMFKSFKTDDELVLEQNPNWDPNTDPGRHQYFDTLTIKWGEDSKKLDSTILSDNGATTMTWDNVLSSDYQSVPEEQLTAGTQPCTSFWYLDMNKIPDLKVRQAIGWAYPYKDSWLAGGDIPGVTITGGTAILPPGIPGRVEYQPLPGNDGSMTDTAKAKSLLEEAGQVGFELKWPYLTDDPLSVAATQKKIASFEAAGFKVSPLAATSDTIYEILDDQKADINIRTSGWCSDWPSGASWFPPLFDGRQAGKPGVPNKSNINEPDFQQMLEATMKLPIEESAAKWGELDQFLMETYYPVVNVGYSAAAMIHGTKIGGMNVDNTLGMPTFDDMYVMP